MGYETETEKGIKEWDVFVFGDANIDLIIPNVDHLPRAGQEELMDTMKTFVGGGAALFTLGLGKLGMRCVFQGVIGNDLYGEFILREFKEKNIDTRLITRSRETGTGISLSFTNENDRGFLTYQGGNARVSIQNVSLEEVAKARHIHITGYEGDRNHQEYLDFMKRLKQKGNVTVSFDLGWDLKEIWNQKIYELFPYIDVLFMNETEAVHYSGLEDVEKAAEKFASMCGTAVVKLGRKGSLAVKDGKTYRADPFAVQAVDTTGAGDSFNAGFMFGFLLGKETEDCLRTGNACGALNVTALGGNTAFPNREKLKNFLKKMEK